MPTPIWTAERCMTRIINHPAPLEKRTGKTILTGMLNARWRRILLFCAVGLLMAAAAMLAKIPKPTDADIDTYVDNICRCGTYPRVRAAIHRAAEATNT